MAALVRLRIFRVLSNRVGMHFQKLDYIKNILSFVIGFLALIEFFVAIWIHWFNNQKLSKNIASEASYVYILSGQNIIENAQNGQFWRVFENLKLTVKKCYSFVHLEFVECLHYVYGHLLRPTKVGLCNNHRRSSESAVIMQKCHSTT